MRVVSTVLFALAACKSDPTPTPTDVEADTDTDTDTDADSDADTDTDTDSDTDVDTDADPCVDDAYEPNETLQTALPPVEDEDLVVCLTSADFWEIELQGEEEVDASITYEAGILDLLLTNLDGDPLATSTTGSGEERVIWANPSLDPTTVVAQVRLYGNQPATYQFRSSIQTCVDELVDDLDAVEGEHSSLVAVDFLDELDRNDLWQLPFETTGLYRVDVTWDAFSYDVAGSAALEEIVAGRHTLWFQNAFEPFLSVRQLAGGCGSYTLAWEELPTCSPDALGPGSHPLVGYAYDVLGLTDQDRWTFELQPGEQTEITLVPTAGLVPELYLEALTGDADPVVSPVLVTNSTSEPQIRTIRVEVGQGTTEVGCTPYELFATVPCTLDDPNEPDDDALQAHTEANGVLSAAGDTDWVALGSVEADESLQVTLGADRVLQADVVTSDGTVLASFVDAFQTVTVSPPATGELFVRILGEPTACDVPYQVTSR